jgi:tetratricopeptide (TPR) repeat protein
MPRPIPPSLGLALTLLRAARGWTQGDLAAAAGTVAGVISGYEKGTRQGLDRERLEELAAAMSFDGAAIDLALAAIGGIQPAAGQASPEPEAQEAPAAGAAAEGRRVRELALRLGLLMAEHGEALLRKVARARRAEAVRREAARLWEELARATPGERRLRIERSPELQTAAICERLCVESEKAAPDDAARALELAGLARRVAELAPGERGEREALLGCAMAFVANARRVGADLEGAEAAFGEALKLWRGGSPADDSGFLAEWRMLDLEASLRRDQRRFDAAAELLDRARELAPEESVGHILLNRAFALEQAGEVEAAIATLREAATLLDGADDPRLSCVLSFNLVANFCHLGQFEEAEALLGEVGDTALELGNELDLLRVLWLSGRVAAGRGRTQEARVALGRARREFAARGDGYDAAFVSLELAIVELEQGRTGAVRALAEEMLPIFERLGFQREALAALRVFCAAARAGTATADLPRRLLSFLERARRDPQLRFEDPA